MPAIRLYRNDEKTVIAGGEGPKQSVITDGDCFVVHFVRLQ
jgi:hypothetical protein